MCIRRDEGGVGPQTFFVTNYENIHWLGVECGAQLLHLWCLSTNMVASVCPAQAQELDWYLFSPVCFWTVETRVNLLRDTCLDVYNGILDS